MNKERGVYKDWFIKNYDLLQENSNVDDLLDLWEYIDKYFAKINWYSNLFFYNFMNFTHNFFLHNLTIIYILYVTNWYTKYY